tara:strand:- start:18487 stop:18753 length:267 start_codon:yes stop_codon:yes gene_type:complete
MNAVDQKKLVSAMQELSDSMTRMDAEKDLVKEIIESTSDVSGIAKKTLRKLANIHHRRNIDEVRTYNSEVEDLYEEVFVSAVNNHSGV